MIKLVGDGELSNVNETVTIILYVDNMKLYIYLKSISAILKLHVTIALSVRRHI